jgi:hypothetical protein
MAGLDFAAMRWTDLDPNVQALVRWLGIIAGNFVIALLLLAAWLLFGWSAPWMAI